MNMGVAEIRALLQAYKQVVEASWPDLHPTMAKRAPRWPAADEAELRAELEQFVAEASRPDCPVRLFWKLGPQFVFGGCNRQFAADAGLSGPADLTGTDDFDRRLPWVAQAAKYRADDKEVFTSGTPKLDIIERQQSGSGITWVRAGKAPIRTADGRTIGVFGMYELLDAEAGRKLFLQSIQKNKPGA